jgi:hypothetical protein
VWSIKVFPEYHTMGIIGHNHLELIEIGQAPSDLSEWIDVIILAVDGAWRRGHEPLGDHRRGLCQAGSLQSQDMADWCTAAKDVAFEHDRS